MTYSAKLLNLNYQGYYFKIGGKIYTKKSIDFSFQNEGCNTIEVFAINLAGQQIYNCRKVWVNRYTGTEAETSISSDSIKTISTGVKADRNGNLFWNHGNAPISPIAATGGFYMAFTGTDDMMVAHEYDSSMKLIKSVNLGFYCYIFDIVTINKGFSISPKILETTTTLFSIALTQILNRLLREHL